MGQVRNLFIIILVICIIVLFAIAVINFPSGYLDESVPVEDGINSSFNNADEVPQIQKDFFYYDTENINYHYASDTICSKSQKFRFYNAFNEITKKTNNTVVFEENDNENSIEISCPRISQDEMSGVSGEAWFFTYEDEKEIYSGNVIIYTVSSNYYNPCIGYPGTEIHEILHAMGFGHITDRESIMNPMGATDHCVELDKKIFDCLIHIYGEDNSLTCEGIPDIYEGSEGDELQINF